MKTLIDNVSQSTNC